MTGRILFFFVNIYFGQVGDEASMNGGNSGGNCHYRRLLSSSRNLPRSPFLTFGENRSWIVTDQ